MSYRGSDTKIKTTVKSELEGILGGTNPHVQEVELAFSCTACAQADG